ncbi:membrane protein [Sediminicola sp. YIK13]|uniref:translocation and assembly module lipoprotein TamL n=1 Tax=Sediminicola sp. YIK13 TaxID=1453352 RepID=UPI00071FE606|nr:BamA/TamA family outer membrane protein [Sediminicola sp. YIK13]ALM09091.1 membrane protein [Sediminicola sp. YIK13]
MRTPFSLKNHTAKIGLLLLGIAITSCNALKRVEDDELLLTKNSIHADGEKINSEDAQSLIFQKPNSALLGYPLRLHLYNLAKKNPDSSYQAWLHKNDKREERLNNLLSKKQVARLGESFMVKGYSEWLKQIGEAPVIIDTSRTRKSLERLKAYYGGKGYFNANATYELDSSKRKQRAAIDYQLTLGNPFIIDSFSKKISSPAVDSIYQLNAKNSLVKRGRQFNIADFNNERERLTNIFRNTGIYGFQESSISYEILRDTTKASDDQKLDVEMSIQDLRKRDENTVTTSKYYVHRFKKVNIYADYLFDTNEDSLQSIDYNNYTIYYQGKLRYKPKALTDAIFIKKDSIYRELDRIRTYRQIANLNTFKYPNIDFIVDSTQSKIDANIYLSARPKYSLQLDTDVTHSNIQYAGLAFSSSLVTRNVFGGAETLSFSARGSVGLLSDASLSDEKYVTEIGGDINLNFPRLWLPFISTNKIIPYYMLPQTKISIGTSFQKNIGLDKNTLNTIYGYNWSPTESKRHNIELINIQYVRNLNQDRFYNVYNNSFDRLNNIALGAFESDPTVSEFFEEDNLQLSIPDGTRGFTQAVLEEGRFNLSSNNFSDVRSLEERRVRLTENNLIFAGNYTFTKNNKQGITDNEFYQFRMKFESAGALLSALENIIPFSQNDNGKNLVFGVPYSEYFKTEFDYIKHWDLSRTNVIAFRSFFGLAIPYGNSENVPFVRSYFAGGSNDNRAWNAYSLGPGTTENLNDFNEANLKLAFNLEYRFPIAGDVKGALFADAGNIWNVFDDVENTEATFNNLSSFGDIALGTGFGLRYDFTYFVFRLDTGFKTYNPAEEPAKRWFRDYNFGNAVFNIGINYPF